MVKEIKGNITNALQQYQSQTQNNYNTSIKGAEVMDFDEFNLDTESMSLEKYRDTLDTIKGNYQGELDNINQLLAVLEYKTMDYKEWVLKYKDTYDINELRSMANEVSNENIQDTINRLKQDKAVFESTIYKIEQLEKTAEYDCLNQVEEYQNYTGPTGYSKEELNKINYDELFTKVYEGNLESYCRAKGIDITKIDLEEFYEKARTEYSGGYEAYCKDTDLANLYELGNEDYIKKYNYYYDKYGKDKAEEYLNNMKDTINEGMGAKRAEEYLSTLKVDENGNYDLTAVSNYLSTMLKGGGEGFESFFEGLTAWIEKDHVYSTSEYEVMYIVQALKENKNLLNVLDNVFELSQSAGNMVPGMVIGMLTSPVVGTITMGTSAGGNSYHSAMVSGSDRVDAIIYGLLSGSSEAALQHFLGAIPGLNDVNVTSFKTWLKATGQEGLEEFVQEYVDGSLRESVLGEDVEQWQLFLDALKSFGYGAIMGGTTNGVSFKVNKILNKNTKTTSYTNEQNTITVNPKNTLEETKNEIENDISSLQKDSKPILSLTNKLKKLSLEPSELRNFLDKVRQNKTNEISGFNSIEDFKKFIIDTLIDTKALDNNGVMYNASADIVMLKRIVEKYNTDNLIVKNLGSDNIKIVAIIVNSYKGLTIEELNKLYSSDNVKEYISNMPLDKFTEMINCFNDDAKWLQCNTFMDKILSLNIEDFYKFVTNLSKQDNNLEILINSGNTELYQKLLDKMSTDFCLEENLIKFYDKLDKIKNLIVDSNKISNNESLNTIVKNIENQLNEATNYLINKVKNNSNVKLSSNKPNELNIINLEKNTYYDLIYEIDGEQKIKEIFTGINNFEAIFYDFIGGKKDYSKEILSDKFKITSINKNTTKTDFIIKGSNLGEGINKIKLLIDGRVEEIYIKSKKMYNSINDYNLNIKYPDAKTAKILDVEKIGTLDIKVNKENYNIKDDLYAIKFLLDGKEKLIYLPTITESDNYILPIELYIENYIGLNNLDRISNLKIEKVSNDFYDKSKVGINNFDSSKEIFSNNNYGGNQSDVKNILINYLENNLLSKINSLKATDIMNMIYNHFPTVNNNDNNVIKKLVRKFEKVGCTYIGFSNSICTYFGTLENGANTFKEIFGYNLYYEDNGVKNYNIETLALDLFLDFFNSQLNYDLDKIITDGHGLTLKTLDFMDYAKKHLKQKGLNIKEIETPTIKNTNLKNLLLSKVLNSPKESFNLLIAEHFDLEYQRKFDGDKLENYEIVDDALQNSTIKGEQISDIGGHCMVVTDIDDKNNLIISSWAKKYKFIVESIEEYNKSNLNSSNPATADIKTYIFEILR